MKSCKDRFTDRKGIATMGMFIILALIIGLVVILVIIKPIPGLLSIFSSSLPNQGSQEEQNLVDYIKEIIGNDPEQAITLCDSFLKEYSQSKLVSEVAYLQLYATVQADLLNEGSSSSLLSLYFFDMVASQDGRRLVESFSSSTSSEDSSYKASTQFYSGLLAIRSANPDSQKMVDFLSARISHDAIFLTPDFAATLKSNVMPYDITIPAESFDYAGVVVLVDSKYCSEVADIYLNKARLTMISSSNYDSNYFDALYTYFFTHCGAEASVGYTALIDEYLADNRNGRQGISRLRDALYKSSYKTTIKNLDASYVTDGKLDAITG